MEAKYISGITVMDQQHEFLISLVEDLHMRVGLKLVDASELVSVRQCLNSYVDTHFSYEEDLMLEHGYPNREDHISKHQFIKSHIEEIFGSSGNTLNTALQILVTLNSWLLHHILKDDFALAAFLKSETERANL